MLPVNSPAPQPSSPHSLLPQGRGSITYGSAGYIQGDQTAYAAQGYSQACQASELLPHSVAYLKSRSVLITADDVLPRLSSPLKLSNSEHHLQ